MLGACLGLGLQRETLGDIRLEGDCAYVAATPAIADYLIDNLHEVGRAKVSLSRYDGELPAAESGRREVVNVPSLRLDAMLAQTLHLSRARAQTLIRGGAVQKNWQITDRTDAEIAQGDVLSIRGERPHPRAQRAGGEQKGPALPGGGDVSQALVDKKGRCAHDYLGPDSRKRIFL